MPDNYPGQPPSGPPGYGGQPQQPQYPQHQYPQQSQYPQQPYPQQYQQPYPQYGVVQQSNGAAVAGGVLGIIALVLAFIPFIDFIAIVMGVLALVFGIVGNNRARQLGGNGRGMALTGIICGIIAVVLSALFLILVYGTLIGLH